ncbi:hypothetical protein WH47_11987 [Habropoda laboriosa]|uniref:Uncharacterized protein n=1 Tax=Habropoda laboriosa TaxID=597456 RepID=A0A0L7R0Z6_9HYME|nr:hypothetical protein WH47_11987 [Habropoda laboriosa]
MCITFRNRRTKKKRIARQLPSVLAKVDQEKTGFQPQNVEKNNTRPGCWLWRAGNRASRSRTNSLSLS